MRAVIEVFHPVQFRLLCPTCLRPDDFRTALHHASSYIKTLSSLSRSVASPSTASTSPSTSSFTQSHTSLEVDRSRIETMSKLTKVFQRNLRVRYEVNFAELMQA